MSKITISEIADQSGVSPATVSRIVNGKDNVNEDTRRRVLNVIAELEKTRGISVSPGRKKKAPVILLVADFDSPVLNDFVSGLQKVALNNGYHVVALDYSKHRTDLLDEVSFLSRSISIAGLVMMNSYESTSTVESLWSRIPTIIAYTNVEVQNVSTIAIDNDACARTIANHLLSLGCRKPVLLGVDLNFAIERMNAVKATFAEAGIEIPEEDTLLFPTLDLDAAASLLNQYLSTHKTPDAVFAINDLLASTAVSVLHKFDFRIPEDVMVAGFDNSTISTLIEPNLTTIDTRSYNVGTQAANLLLGSIRNPQLPPQHIAVQGNLIVRESTLRSSQQLKDLYRKRA